MTETPDRDAEIVSLALQQGGYIHGADLRRVGLERRSRERHQRDGVLQRVRRGLYSVVDITAQDAWYDRVWRAVVQAGDGTVVARETAARLHGIVGGPTVTPVQLVIPPRRRVVHIPGVDAKRVQLDSRDITVVAGLRVTTPLRTVLDCSRFSDRLTAVCLFESAARQGLICLDEVATVLAEMYKVPHVKRAKEALRLVDVRSESPLETAVRLPLLDAGLPYPELQLPFLCGGVAGRIDIAYPVELLGGRPGGRYVGLAIEADGREPHLEAQTFDHDRVRQTALEEADWLVRRFTDRKARLAPSYVVETTRRAMALVLR
jgi:hypothetical protein